MTTAISTISRSLTQLGQFSAPLAGVLPRLRTAGRVGLHASGLMSGWASALPVDEVDLSFFKNSFAGAMELHERVLSDPDKREALARAERGLEGGVRVVDEPHALARAVPALDAVGAE